MADDHQSAGMALQEGPQPADGISVEVIGGFVEEQRGVRTGTRVRGGKQDPAQFDAPPLTTGQCSQGLGQDPLGQAEARTDPASLPLGGIPAECGEALIELSVTSDRLVPGGVIGHLGHDRLLLLQIREQRIQPTRRENPVASQHVEVTLPGVLRQIADLTGAFDGARIGFAFTGQDPHRGGLTSSVATDQTDAVARLNA